MMRDMARKKGEMLTVRVSADVLQDYKLAADLKGASMSGLVHMFIVQTIRDQKERNPEAFRKRNEYERPVVKVKIKGKAKHRKNNP